MKWAKFETQDEELDEPLQNETTLNESNTIDKGDNELKNLKIN